MLCGYSSLGIEENSNWFIYSLRNIKKTQKNYTRKKTPFSVRNEKKSKNFKMLTPTQCKWKISHLQMNVNCYNPTIDAAKWNYLYSTPVTLRQTIMGKWQQKAYNSGSHTCYFQYINIHTGFHLLSFSAFCLRGSFVAFLTTGITIMQLTLQWWGRKRHSPFAHLERLAWKPSNLSQLWLLNSL